jgi:hypothetical protein
MSFHGSYRTEDVEFLLKPIPMALIEDTLEKERLIQTGQRHYSEMLSSEKLPSARYRQLFYQAHEMNRVRMARDCVILAKLIHEQVGNNPTLVSLARAGTPVGAILGHLLRQITGQPIPHYSVSIIRDRGIDANALDTILARGTAAKDIVFIDGWTGKGVITAELTQAVSDYNAARGTSIRPDLYVLADLAGKAFCAATVGDYLIPSSILNSTISGLVSRSILNDAIGQLDYHGCVQFLEFSDHDLSVWFVDEIVSLASAMISSNHVSLVTRPYDRQAQSEQSDFFIAEEMTRYCISDRNLIKPGIGEATRVLLRRLPDRLIIRDLQLPDVRHLVVLAQEKNVLIEERSSLQLNAVSIIRSASDA